MSGLYVTTNLSSIIAQNQLTRNMAELSDVLTRLSTGLKINSGKDDPAGLIASELLKSDITGLTTAISNAQRANSIIGIADSALGQISNLLNDVKGLIVESANTAAMSSDQIKANQLQVDATLDSIDRIAKTTNYQGSKLLDGSMDFETRGVKNSLLTDLRIYEANFGTQSQVDVDIQIQKTASQAQLIYNKSGISEAVVLEVGGNNGTEVYSFDAGASVSQIAEVINRNSDSTGVQAVVGQDATYGQLLATSAGLDNDINFMALVAGYDGGNYTIKYSAGNAEETTYKITPPSGGEPGTIEFFLKMQEAQPASVTNLDQSYNGVYTTAIDVANLGAIGTDDLIIQSTNGQAVKSYSVVQTTNATVQPSADYDAKTGHLQLLVNANTTNEDIAKLINGIEGLTVVNTPTPAGTTVAALAPASGTTLDARTNNMLDISAVADGTTFENTDVIFLRSGNNDAAVTFDYKNSGAKASISLVNAANMAGSQFLKLTATEAGAEYNDVTVVFDHSATAPAGTVGVTYDAETKRLVIYGQLTGTNAATLSDLKAAIEKNTPFKAEFFTDSAQTTAAALSNQASFANVSAYDESLATPALIGLGTTLKTGQIASDLGSDHQALIITVGNNATANDVVAAFQTSSLTNLFAIQNSNGSNGLGTIFRTDDPASWVYSGALTGGNSGYETAVTAAELIDLVNNDATLSQILRADLALNSPSGAGYLTLFDEYAYYGDPNAGTALQFLGPANSADIIFASNLTSNGTKVANQELAMWFTDQVEGYSSISMAAKNANAAVTVTAKNKGSDYDDMVIRYVHLDNTYDGQDGFATYTAGSSTSMAYCSINDANTGEATETGKFIVYSVQGGEAFNDVDVVIKLDTNQAESATAYYDQDSKQLIVTVNHNTVKLTEAVEAINQTGTFTADYDFSFNNATTGTGPANADFTNVLGTGKTTAVVGNTGQTGGHSGGVLTVYLASGTYNETTAPLKGTSANAVVNIINSDPVLKELFTASHYGSSSGTGAISFREDNVKEVTGGCGEIVTVPASVSTGGVTQEAQMVIQLATDQYGNYTTTAAELVAFFDQLTAEQTRGVSVSLVLPTGADNLLRSWTVDECGNVIESQECENPYGNGILNPLFELDDCDQLVYEVIQFTSYGSNIQPTNASDDIIAVNGWESMFTVSSELTGEEYEGITLVYERITDANEAPSASYDEAKRQIVVRILEGETTAAEVKAAIEADAITGAMFNVTLKKDGAATVTVSDDSLSTANGTYEAGYRGGARMLGAADEDPHKLTFVSIYEGSDQRVSVKAKSGNFEVKNTDGDIVDTAYGTDMEALINGMKAAATGRNLSINTTTLKLETTVADTLQAGDRIQFSITGGGAIFQVGPDVVSNQQIRIGLQSVNTASLGGVSGQLYQLRTGGNADLVTSDESRKLADKIVDEAILAIATMRGRLGTIQRSTLEPTIAALQDQMEALVSAEAMISNADFAEESSRLTRAQILVQSGARALSLANQFPQYAASLLGG